jgi:hypothetical protein
LTEFTSVLLTAPLAVTVTGKHAHGGGNGSAAVCNGIDTLVRLVVDDWPFATWARQTPLMNAVRAFFFRSFAMGKFLRLCADDVAGNAALQAQTVR